MFDRGRQDKSSGIGPGRSPRSDGERAVVDGWVTAPTGVRGILPAGLSTMAPGPELAATLAGIDRSMLNGYELVILIQAERRQVAHYKAASFESMTELSHCSHGYAGSPAERHIDHHHPWAEGGETEPENLGPGCRHDHILKEKGGWNLRRNPDGSYTWTSRHGHTYPTRLQPP